jgi:methylenetetrahydrofolate dehydrogenase (NADP+)/methenyltetrahydrofolate cyclohydrolase
MQLIDGKAIAAQVLRELAEQVADLGPPAPCVAFIRVGDDPASVSYVRSKEKRAAETGIESRLHLFPETITEASLLREVEQLNADPSVHGILVQAPLPGQISEKKVFNHVLPNKDVDGFSAANLGRLVQEDPDAFVACTPAGIVELLHRSKIETEGKHVVVVGRSLIVGKPASLLFLRKAALGNATVTVCHSRTRDLAGITRQADILIAAIGRPRFITDDMVKEGAVVIDVGINRVEDAERPRGYRLVGDVDFDSVAPRTSFITPAPGGVGPMTVAMLMKNTVKARQLASAKGPA